MFRTIFEMAKTAPSKYKQSRLWPCLSIFGCMSAHNKAIERMPLPQFAEMINMVECQRVPSLEKKSRTSPAYNVSVRMSKLIRFSLTILFKSSRHMMTYVCVAGAILPQTPRLSWSLENLARPLAEFVTGQVQVREISEFKLDILVEQTLDLCRLLDSIFQILRIRLRTSTKVWGRPNRLRLQTWIWSPPNSHDLEWILSAIIYNEQRTKPISLNTPHPWFWASATNVGEDDWMHHLPLRCSKLWTGEFFEGLPRWSLKYTLLLNLIRKKHVRSCYHYSISQYIYLYMCICICMCIYIYTYHISCIMYQISNIMYHVSCIVYHVIISYHHIT